MVKPMKDKISKLKKKVKKTPEEPSVNSRVTNDTLAAHREEVLRGARRYIYPLQHTKNRLVVISVTVFLISLISFFAYSAFALYKEKTYSDFMYKVTKVIPFPIARIGSNFIDYEDYLFEIKHYVHYYETQQELDFNSDAGRAQLSEFKKRALDKVVNDAYIKMIAKEKGIEVSEQDIDEQIAVVRNQNRLSNSDSELEAILKDYWDWNISDFRRSLKTQLLAEKVISNLDTEAHDKASAALAQLKNGKDFAKLATEISEDKETRARGGEIPFLIEETNRDISPRTVDALFSLKEGEFSEVINVGYGLQIVKNVERKGDSIKASQIVFNFKDINQYLNDIKEEKPIRTYISL